MQAVGIIAEYNPFHNGHKWHLEEAKRHSGQNFSIAVMSGNFVQRGETAIFDKWQRASLAVRSGVDLVIELPFVFSIRSAQYFAAGGLTLLDRLGVVSHLCFGAENADMIMLKKAATAMNDKKVSLAMLSKLKSGATYAAALGYALEKETDINLNVLKSPNNILAVEYLRAMQDLNSNIIPLPIQRRISHHHDTTVKNFFASAGAIRKALAEKNFHLKLSMSTPNENIPSINELLASRQGPARLQALSAILLGKLRTASLEYIEQLPDVSEGLHNKIKECSLKAHSLEEMLSMIKSKRYTRTRLQRILIHALLGTQKQQIMSFDQTGPLYARVLAFNSNGRTLLREINQKASIPVITKTSQFLTSKQRDKKNLNPLQKMLAIDTLASDLFVLALPDEKWFSGGLDFTRSPIYMA